MRSCRDFFSKRSIVSRLANDDTCTQKQAYNDEIFSIHGGVVLLVGYELQGLGGDVSFRFLFIDA